MLAVLPNMLQLTLRTELLALPTGGREVPSKTQNTLQAGNMTLHLLRIHCAYCLWKCAAPVMSQAGLVPKAKLNWWEVACWALQDVMGYLPHISSLSTFQLSEKMSLAATVHLSDSVIWAIQTKEGYIKVNALVWTSGFNANNTSCINEPANDVAYLEMFQVNLWKMLCRSVIYATYNCPGFLWWWLNCNHDVWNTS